MIKLYKADKDLENKLKKFNDEVKKSYGNILNLEKNNLKNFIASNIGPIYKSSKPSKEAYLNYEKLGGIIGVDGSVNRKGGASPHYVDFFRALAKSTKKQVEDRIINEIYSPILDKDMKLVLEDDGELENKRNQILSKIEVEVAIDAAKELKPFLIMMDGTFIRYIIDCKSTWEELRDVCEREKILLIGVIEDIKTHIIGSKLLEMGYTDRLSYDRELLFGRLDVGEYIVIEDSDKTRAGQLTSALMRSSNNPNIIGIDIIDTQRGRLSEMVDLIFGLTPENSRGVPIWLDIVDSEVKISHNTMEAYLESYLDSEIYERYFVETRSKR